MDCRLAAFAILASCTVLLLGMGYSCQRPAIEHGPQFALVTPEDVQDTSRRYESVVGLLCTLCF
jgi:hypothetical protein